MMMGVGNLTELTEVDSAGVNTAAGRLLPGTGDQERAHDGRDQLGPLVRPRAGPGRDGWLIMRSGAGPCPSISIRGWSCSATPRSNGSAPRISPSFSRRIRDPNWRIFAEDGLIYALNNTHFLSGAVSFRALRTAWKSPIPRTRSTWATR